MSLQGCEHGVGVCTGACMGDTGRDAEPCAVCGTEDAGDEGFCETCAAALNANCECPNCRPAPAMQRVTVGGARPGETMEIDVPVYAPAPAAVEDEPTAPMPVLSMSSMVWGAA